ncbi:hypothetical protein B0H14DRAFT_2421732, partial [Mycena olivaceomarginata]
VAHETMRTDVTQGGKQIVGLPTRNEAIDLWNLQSYLTQGTTRPSWCCLVDYLLQKYLETSYLNFRPSQVLNVFTQDIHVLISSKTPLPGETKRMILTTGWEIQDFQHNL